MRRALDAEVEVIGGPYGEFKVFIDDALVLEGGALAALGVLPSSGTVIDAIRERLSPPPPPEDA